MHSINYFVQSLFVFFANIYLLPCTWLLSFYCIISAIFSCSRLWTAALLLPAYTRHPIKLNQLSTKIMNPTWNSWLTDRRKSKNNTTSLVNLVTANHHKSTDSKYFQRFDFKNPLFTPDNADTGDAVIDNVFNVMILLMSSVPALLCIDNISYDNTTSRLPLCIKSGANLSNNNYYAKILTITISTFKNIKMKFFLLYCCLYRWFYLSLSTGCSFFITFLFLTNCHFR